MQSLYDVAAIGNAIVDVISPATEDFLVEHGLTKGAMILIDDARAVELYGHMAPGVEASGGSAGNTIAGLASLGGRGAFIGKLGQDQLGDVFAHDIESIGAKFSGGRIGDHQTGRCLINVTPDGQRTMCTFLGAAAMVSPDDVDPAIIEAAAAVYLEGYQFDPPEARRAFAKAAGLARGAGRLIALSLSDSFVVHRHRPALLGFIDSEVDILFANEDEICALFETDSFDAAAEAIRGRAKIAAITRGPKGSVVIAGDDAHAVPAAPVDKVVDTTGAGDQYAAGFLHALAQGHSLPACARWGGLAAAEVISHYGPRPQTSLKALAAAAGL
ncbi:adenosine kinase [Phenylobacterium montanum]|uniref:Adenosine kinase n=1 Tax=Phenylobacterium montanum TaxID=2823693 RepID=A0A975FXA4_9CAUL|nr:adenosine kinase [Caulobacter sp. S6]QUD86532.1 adenosine kinase [Caulobacter sp. S6]